MKSLNVVVVGLWLFMTLSSAPAVARPMKARLACCRAPAGTVVEVELAAPVSTKVQKSGDTFALRLAAPLIVNGRIVLRAGTPGVGDVIESAKPGLGGKGAKLVLDADYLRVRGRRVPLEGLELSGAGKDNSMAAQALGLTGIAFAPLGFVGLAVQGGDVTFPAGTKATAKLTLSVTLASLGRASRRAALRAAARGTSPVAGAIEIPRPPAGEGQVVFFRAKSLLGMGQWFNVREDGKVLGKLTNGAYFVQTTDPGRHTYTAKEEPEFNDHLTLKVDPGETYFVQGTLTKGLLIGVADLSPSNRATFDKASWDLKAAEPPNAETASDAPSGEPASASAAAAEKAAQ